jgi:IclR family transcriptional regulator, acetate operon repressor
LQSLQWDVRLVIMQFHFTNGRSRGQSLKKDSDSVRAVDRALEILLAFDAKDRGLTVAELLKRVNLSRPTLYRLLRTLEQKGFLASSGDPQRLRLGPAVAQLTHVGNANTDISAVAEPMMRRVWEQTGETVALFLPEGLFRVCVAEIPSSQPLSFKRGVGYRERLVLGASGRAILAHTRPYAQELSQVRQRGFAVSRNELIQGAVAVAAPFFGAGDQVAGALGIFGPSVRLSPAQVERFGKLLVKEARQLSSALGQLSD